MCGSRSPGAQELRAAYSLLTEGHKATQISATTLAKGKKNRVVPQEGFEPPTPSLRMTGNRISDGVVSCCDRREMLVGRAFLMDSAVSRYVAERQITDPAELRRLHAMPPAGSWRKAIPSRDCSKTATIPTTGKF
jgi:hypothetical protein